MRSHVEKLLCENNDLRAIIAQYRAALEKALALLVVDSDPPGLVTIEDTEASAVIETYEAISQALTLSPKVGEIGEEEIRGNRYQAGFVSGYNKAKKDFKVREEDQK